jgi:hypothetical protein
MESDIQALKDKVGHITVSQAVNLDTMESDTQTALSYSTASKTKTDLITVTQPINLDNVADLDDLAKLNFITITAPVNLDSHREELQDLWTALGLTQNSENFGSFDSPNLPDNEDAKALFIALASAIDAIEAGQVDLSYVSNAAYGRVSAGGTDATLPLGTAEIAGLLAPAQFTKLANLTVSSALNLDLINTYVTASKAVTDLITVSSPINLNTLSTNASASKSVTDLLTVSSALNLDTLSSDVSDLRDDVDALVLSGASVDLAYVPNAGNSTITNTAGTDATIPTVNDTYSGLMTPTQKAKLDGIATGATANASNAELRDRSTHTGTQTAATISDFNSTAAAAAPVQTVAGRTGNVALAKIDVGLGNVDNTADLNKPISTAVQTALNAKQNSLGFTPENVVNKGIANGYASLGSDGKIPSSQLPEGGSYQGTWNANTNTPTITSGSGSNGDFYLVSTAGTTTIDTISSWSVGDQIRFNGTVWEKIPTTASVSSVAGKTGAVTLVPGDVGLGNVTNVAQAPATRTITAGAGLTGGGDLTANRTLAVSFGTTASTACEGNDSRLSDARTPLAHTHTAANVTDFNAAASAAAPVQSVAGRSGAVTLAVADVSGAAPLASPALTGTPTAPTPSSGDDTTKIATTAFVKAQGYVTSSGVTSVGGTAPIVSSGGATPSISISAATTSAAGSMSAADKTKMDRITISSSQNIDTIASNASSAKTKTDFLTVTQAVNLDTIETDSLASKAKTDYLTVNTPVNLNTVQEKTAHLTVTAATDLDAMRSKLGFLTLTQNADLDAIELDVSQHQSLFGVADGSTNIGTFTGVSRDSARPLIQSSRSIYQALQDVVQAFERERCYNVLDYGADPTGVTSSSDAIDACILAAYNARTTISSGTSSSINDPLQLTVWFPEGRYTITRPIVQSNHCFNIAGDRAVIVASSDFHTNHPYGWAIELGEQSPANTAIVDLQIKGLIFAEFRRHIRMGAARNNVNVGRMLVDNCKFIGLHDYPSLCIRIFNRSADAVFYRCTFDTVDQIIDVQSCDKVTFYDCRCQLGNYHEWQANYTGKAGNTIGKTSYLPGDVVYVNYGGSWKLYECNTANSDAAFTVGKWTYLKDVDPYTGLFRVQRGRLMISNFVGNPIQTAYTRTNPFGWFLADEFRPWAASSLYIEGDMIKKAYDTGGNEDIFWARKTGQDGYSGAAWDSTERAKWQICDAPEWNATYSTATGYVVNDVVRVLSAGTFYYYRCNTANTDAAFTVGKWDVIDSTTEATQGQCMSVWCTIRVCDDSFLGAEGAGIVPMIWNAPDRVAANGSQLTMLRRYISQCYLQDSYCASGKTFGIEGLVPAVLLITHPQVLVIENNMWNDSYRCVAASYKSGETPPVRPGAASDGISRANCYKVTIRDNYGGTSGTTAGSSPATVYRDYSPNWAPLDLIAPRFPQFTGASGEPLLTESDYFRANNSTAVTHYGFQGTTEGKRFVIYFETANHTLANSADYINLAGGVNVTPPANSWMEFEVRNGTVWEIRRSFHKETYTPTNVVTDRAYDANATTVEELADVLGTLIADLKKKGIVA